MNKAFCPTNNVHKHNRQTAYEDSQFRTARLVCNTGTCPLDFDFQQFNFFELTLQLHKSDSDFVRLPLQTYLYSVTTAAVVQLRLREPSLVYYFASNRMTYVKQLLRDSCCETVDELQRMMKSRVEWARVSHTT